MKEIVKIISLLITLDVVDGSSCTNEQVMKCRDAVENNSLKTLSAGGICWPQQYVHYTHSCNVNNMQPHIDHCCCYIQQTVLCCRYQQSWDRFRCSKPEDTIGYLSQDKEGVHFKPHPNDNGVLNTLTMVFIITLPSISSVFCLIFCTYKYIKYFKNKRKKRSKEASRVYGMKSFTPNKANFSPINDYTPKNYTIQRNHNRRSFYDSSNCFNPIVPIIEPSAPPFEHMQRTEIYSPTSPFNLVSIKHSTDRHIVQPTSKIDNYSVNNDNDESHKIQSFLSEHHCPPPDYEESMNHVLMS